MNLENTYPKEVDQDESKLPFFFDFMPGETVYSLVSRFVTISDLSSRRTSYILFGSEKTINNSIVGNLDHFCHKTNIKDPVEILMKHTNLPFYLLNFNDEEKSEIIKELISGDVQRILTLIAFRKDQIKICKQCAAEDLDIYGLAYLRREHQIPGINFCCHHKTHLYELIVGKESYANLYKFETKTIRIGDHENLQIQLAEIAFDLLKKDLNKQEMDAFIKQHLINNKYITSSSNKKANIRKLEKDLEKYFSVELLKDLGLSGFENRLNWLEHLIYRSKDCKSKPIVYIVCIAYFASCVNDFFNIEVNYKINKSRKPKTEKELMDKRSILDKLVLEGISRKELYNNQSKLYVYFVRYDKEYLDSVIEKKTSKPRITDWNNEDQNYLKQCQELYLSLKQSGTYPRITVRFIVNKLGKNSIRYYKAKLPKTYEFLYEITETHDQARIRKFCNTANQLVLQGKYTWEDLTANKVYIGKRQANYKQLNRIKDEVNNYIAKKREINFGDPEYKFK